MVTLRYTIISKLIIQFINYGTQYGRLGIYHLVFLGCRIDRVYLSVLVEEVQHCLIATLIFLNNLGILQVRASGHPAMDLCWESLDVVGDRKISLEGTDIIGRLILGGQTGEWHVDGFGVVRVDHGRVSLGSSLEDLVVCTCG